MDRLLSLVVCASLLTAGFVLVPREAAAQDAFFYVQTETVARGTSTGFANEQQDDNILNVKTEGGTSRSRMLLPNADTLATDWSEGGSSGCIPATTEFCYIDDDPVSDGNTTILFNNSLPGTAIVSRHGYQDWPGPTDITIDQVTNWIWERTNATPSDDFSFRIFSGSPVVGCTVSIPVDTQVFTNFTTIQVSDCAGVTWTIANVNTILQEFQGQDVAAPNDPGLTVTAAGMTVAYRDDFSASFTSNFVDVVGLNTILRWQCTTTDSEGLDLFVDDVRRSAGVCSTSTDGFFELGSFETARNIAIRLSSPTLTPDGSESTYTFDVLRIEAHGAGGAILDTEPKIRGVFPCIYTWFTRTFTCRYGWNPPFLVGPPSVLWTLEKGGVEVSKATGLVANLPTNAPPWDLGADAYRVRIVVTFPAVGSYPFAYTLRDDDGTWAILFIGLGVLFAVTGLAIRRARKGD